MGYHLNTLKEVEREGESIIRLLECKRGGQEDRRERTVCVD